MMQIIHQMQSVSRAAASKVTGFAQRPVLSILEVGRTPRNGMSLEDNWLELERVRDEHEAPADAVSVPEQGLRASPNTPDGQDAAAPTLRYAASTMGTEEPQFWHVRVGVKNPHRKASKSSIITVVDKDRAWVEARVLEPRRRAEPITINGQQLAWPDIESVNISVSDVPASTIIKQLQAEDARSSILVAARPEYERRAAKRARDVTNELIDAQVGAESAHPAMPGVEAPDPRSVMVVYGRDTEANDAMFGFLRALDLKPQEWSTLVRYANSGAPYVGEVVSGGFGKAKAVVVLLTPDDEARLCEELCGEHEPDHEKTLMGQARPNVLFEAGMAFGTHPDQTVVVELGTLRPFSDIHGRHTIRLDGTAGPLHDIAQRLKDAGCEVDESGRDWLKTDRFPEPRHRGGSSTPNGARRKELLTAAAGAVTNALDAFERRKGATEENVTERGEAFNASVHEVALLANRVAIEFGQEHPAAQAYERALARLKALKALVFDAQATVLHAELGEEAAKATREAASEFINAARTAGG
jgi:predicted nucleotide-binding protein